VRGHSEGPADGRTEAETLFDRITTPPKVQKLQRALYRKAKAEPHPKSQTKLREKLREKLNHWTLWRAADEVIPELNRLLKGWGGYFHYANSTRRLCEKSVII
jgi:hypothetical protein